jgi:hypothetical protein
MATVLKLFSAAENGDGQSVINDGFKSRLPTDTELIFERQIHVGFSLEMPLITGSTADASTDARAERRRPCRLRQLPPPKRALGTVVLLGPLSASFEREDLLVSHFVLWAARRYPRPQYKPLLRPSGLTPWQPLFIVFDFLS